MVVERLKCDRQYETRRRLMTNINYKPAVLGMQEKHHSSAVEPTFTLLLHEERGFLIIMT